INDNETILLGMAVKQDENIQGMMASLATLIGHFSTLEGRIDNLEGHFGAFEQNVNNRFWLLEDRFGTLEGRFGLLEDRLGTLEHGGNNRFEGKDKKLDQIMLLLDTFISKPE